MGRFKTHEERQRKIMANKENKHAMKQLLKKGQNEENSTDLSPNPIKDSIVLTK
jgi:hypothetical protein